MLPSNSPASRARIVLIATFCACILVCGCAKKKHRSRPLAAPRIGSTETGIASWYGYPYHGRRAANGEIYDMEKLTAAHRTLPFGTWVEVQNLDNSKVVTVRITDRGPFIDGRIIDLSKAAAREIAMIGPGIARVKLKIVTAPSGVAPAVAAVANAPVVAAPATPAAAPSDEVPSVEVGPALYAVQIGAFQDRGRAESLRRQYESEYGTARLVLRSGNPPLWRVLVGAEPTMEAANELRARMKTAGQQSFIVRLDEVAAPAPR